MTKDKIDLTPKASTSKANNPQPAPKTTTSFKKHKPHLSSVDKLINTFCNLIEQNDTLVPEKVYKAVVSSYLNGITQRDDLFYKLSCFCKKYFNLFKSLVSGKGEITLSNAKNNVVYMDDPNETDAEGQPIGTPDTIFVETSTGGSLLDITTEGITYASGTVIEANGKFFVSDEKDLSEYLRSIKGLLEHFTDSSEDVKKALEELKEIVLKCIDYKK